MFKKKRDIFKHFRYHLTLLLSSCRPLHAKPVAFISNSEAEENRKSPPCILREDKEGNQTRKFIHLSERVFRLFS